MIGAIPVRDRASAHAVGTAVTSTPRISVNIYRTIPDDIPALWDQLPINVFFSDSAGKATRAVLEADGQPKWIN
jgi:hypothetical protein